jgi:phosphoribosylamine--glycine ligase
MQQTPSGLRVMVIGKDARTDAIAAGLAKSPLSPHLIGVSEFSAPGLMARCATFYGDVSLVDVSQLVQLAKYERPDLVVVGPEEPLEAGVVDELQTQLNVPCFGPRKGLAQIETSKTWCRELLSRYGIAGNPRHLAATSDVELRQFTSELGDFVVKPDGLTGGKGVKLSHLHFEAPEEALDYARGLLRSDGVVLIEEVLDGEEFSLQSITDGETTVHTPIVQDHKRAWDGDTGPNTGGMGSYSCSDFSLPFLTPRDVATAQRTNERVVAALKAETGQPYRGVLYGGFIATRDGIKLIEYNARFGDPEAMNVLPLLETDLLDVCWKVAHGVLKQDDVSFRHRATVCKYVVPRGYPVEVKHSGDEFVVDPQGISSSVADVFWAAVRQLDDRTVLTGSRAVGCVGFGDSLDEANRNASSMVDRVDGPVYSRSDIGSRELIDRRIAHMKALREKA